MKFSKILPEENIKPFFEKNHKGADRWNLKI